MATDPTHLSYGTTLFTHIVVILSTLECLSRGAACVLKYLESIVCGLTWRWDLWGEKGYKCWECGGGMAPTCTTALLLQVLQQVTIVLLLVRNNTVLLEPVTIKACWRRQSCTKTCGQVVPVHFLKTQLVTRCYITLPHQVTITDYAMSRLMGSSSSHGNYQKSRIVYRSSITPWSNRWLGHLVDSLIVLHHLFY